MIRAARPDVLRVPLGALLLLHARDDPPSGAPGAAGVLERHGPDRGVDRDQR